MTPTPSAQHDWVLRELLVFEGSALGLRSPSVCALLVFSQAPGSAYWRGRFEALLSRLVAALGRSPVREAGKGWLAFVDLAQGVLQSAGVALPEPPLWQLVRQSAGQATRSPRASTYDAALTFSTLAPRQTAVVLRWLFEVLAEFQHDASLAALSPARQAQWDLHQKRLLAQAPTGSNNPKFIKAAYRLALPWLRITANHFQFGWGRRGRWLKSSQTDATPALGMQIARDKAQANLLFKAAGLPVPLHYEVSSLDAALTAADKIGYPVVVKPADLDGGLGAKADLQGPQAVAKAYAAAFKHSKRVLVEQHIAGNEYRLTVHQGKLLWAHQRLPAAVLGDGVSSVQVLVEQENARRAEALAQDTGAQQPIRLDADALEYLADHGMEAGFVPVAGQSVRLQRVPAATLGGGGKAFTHSIHPDNTRLAERAVRLLRMDMAGVDLLMPDITRSWREVGGAVTEVNAIPQISSLTEPFIFDRVLCQMLDGDGRVPVMVVQGTGPTPAWLGALAARLDTAGLCVGISTPEGLGIAGQWVQGPRKLAFKDLHALQLDPTVGAILVYTNGQEFLQTGLPMDVFDLLVVTDPSEPSSTPLQARALRQLLSYCKRQVFVLGQDSGAQLAAASRTASPLPWTKLSEQPEVLLETLFDAILQADAVHAIPLKPIQARSEGEEI